MSITFEYLKSEFCAGHISRRAFLRRAAAMGLLTAVPAGLPGGNGRRT